MVKELPRVSVPEKPQPLKALWPILVTEFGMVSEPVKPVHW